MDWIIGGTKDSRNFIENILNQTTERDFIITVATDYGKKLLEDYKVEVLVKPMTCDEMKIFIKENNIKRIFDMSHPYAKDVSKNAILASQENNIEYFRFERRNLNEDLSSDVLYFENISDIINFISNISENILVTLGSNQIESFKNLNNLGNLYFRILPTKIAIEKLENCGILAKNIIAIQGPFSKDFNSAIIKNYNIKYLITKESGTTGGELEKLQSAKENNITTLILKRPSVNYPWITENISDIINIYFNKERK